MRSAPADRADRLPPRDDDAERVVLGACLRSDHDDADGFDGQLLTILLMVKSEDFVIEATRLTYEAINEVFAQGKAVSVESVAGRLRERGDLATAGGVETLRAYARDIHISKHVRDAAQSVRDKATLRRMLRWTSDVRDMIHAREHEPREVVAEVATQALRFADSHSGPTTVTPRVTETEDWDTVERALMQDFDVTPARFGVGQLDAYTGGLGNMYLTLLMAMQGSGKTRFAAHATLTSALQFMRFPEEERPHVLVFPLEEGRTPWVRNAVAWLAGVNAMDLMPGRALKSKRDELHKKARQGHQKLLSLPVVIGENVSTADHLTTLIRIEARRRKIGLVVIDYLQRLGRTAEEERRALGEVSLDLQSLSETMGVPILLLSQMSFSDVSGSVLPYGGRGPAFDASLAIILARKDGPDGRKLDEGTLTCEKARPIPEFPKVEFHVNYRNGGHYYDKLEWADAQARERSAGTRMEVRNHEPYGNS